jgi:hypothetical protein
VQRPDVERDALTPTDGGESCNGPSPSMTLRPRQGSSTESLDDLVPGDRLRWARPWFTSRRAQQTSSLSEAIGQPRSLSLSATLPAFECLLRMRFVRCESWCVTAAFRDRCGGSPPQDCCRFQARSTRLCFYSLR